MNKTLTINLGGLVFHIDEEAYKKLEEYLSRIKKSLKNEEGKAEIIQDIEARIAELFRSWKTATQVIGQIEVDKIQEILGRPEDYLDEYPEESAKNEFEKENEGKTETEKDEHQSKKLFRDKENGKIAGVCAGIAEYIGIDVTWIRLLIILLTLAYGATIVLYIILWVVMPEVKTTADRLRMKGKPINLKNIKETTEKLGTNLQNNIKNAAPRSKNLGDFIVSAIHVIGEIILIFIGVIILTVTFFLLIAFLACTYDFLFKRFEYTQFFIHFIPYNWQYYLWIFAIALTILSLLVLLLKLGLNCVSRNLKWNKKITFGLLIAFFIGIATLIGLGIAQASQAAYRYNYEKEYTLPAQDSITLPISIIPSYHWLKEENTNHIFHFGMMNKRNYFSDSSGNLIHTFDKVNLQVKKSIDKEIHLVTIFHGRGQNQEDAVKNTRSIRYKVQIDSSQIKVEDGFYIPKNVKWRSQNLRSVLYLPVGQKVSIEKRFNLNGNLINYEYDEDSEKKRTWQMTQSGLVCLDCKADNDEDYGIYKSGKKAIYIDKKGIHISNEEGSLDIDEEGIKFKKKEH